MTRWLVTGAAGMLGRDLVELLRDSGREVVGLGHGELDVTDAAAVLDRVRDVQPDVVVNCAAWTAVDDAEAREQEATVINGDGAGHVAVAAAEAGARLVHLSTDYVFSGTATHPYAEDDPPEPRTAYGRSKLAGEMAVLQELPDAGYVLRTAWLYGEHGPSFVRTMIRLESQRDQVRVVADQIGQPTWTMDVARQILLLADSSAWPGIYHATSTGSATWCELAREVFRLLGADPARVRPTTTAEFPRPAARPAYSVLGHEAWASAGLPGLPHWVKSLGRAFPSLAAAAGRDLASAPAPTLPAQ